MPGAWYYPKAGSFGTSSMEYTFSPSPQTAPYVLTLTDKNLVIALGKSTREVPYQDIRTVFLTRNRHECTVQLYTRAAVPVTICNYTITDEGTRQLQTNAFILFTRVLHHHLAAKGSAEFFVSNDYSNAWVTSGIVMSAAALLVLAFRYLNWEMDYVTYLLIGTGTFMPILVAFWLCHFPKPYTANDIPLDFLP